MSAGIRDRYAVTTTGHDDGSERYGLRCHLLVDRWDRAVSVLACPQAVPHQRGRGSGCVRPATVARTFSSDANTLSCPYERQAGCCVTVLWTECRYCAI